MFIIEVMGMPYANYKLNYLAGQQKLSGVDGLVITQGMIVQKRPENRFKVYRPDLIASASVSLFIAFVSFKSGTELIKVRLKTKMLLFCLAGYMSLLSLIAYFLFKGAYAGLVLIPLIVWTAVILVKGKRKFRRYVHDFMHAF